jgi:hypothetical protein
VLRELVGLGVDKFEPNLYFGLDDPLAHVALVLILPRISRFPWEALEAVLAGIDRHQKPSSSTL